MKKMYVGIDVSKEKLDLAITADGQKILGNTVVKNNLDGFKKILKWIENYSKNIHFCMESTGDYQEEAAEYLIQKGFTVSIINPYQSKAFAGSRLLRTKNDKVDAGLLASYCAITQPKATILQKEEVKKLRKLIRYLNTLVESRAKEKTRLHRCKDRDVADVVIATINFLNQSISLIESKIKEHVKKSKKLKHQFDLLKSINGIGYKTAWEILAEIHIEDGESLNVKAQVAHAGLAPREFQSGKSINKKPRICRTGNSKLRKALYMPAMTAMRKNPVLSEFYQKLLKVGKAKKVALIAVMRKLLVIAIGVLRNDKPFDPNWAKFQQEKYLLCA